MNIRPFTFLYDWYFWIFYMNRAIQTELGTPHIALGRDATRGWTRYDGGVGVRVRVRDVGVALSLRLAVRATVSVCARKRAV